MGAFQQRPAQAFPAVRLCGGDAVKIGYRLSIDAAVKPVKGSCQLTVYRYTAAAVRGKSVDIEAVQKAFRIPKGFLP